MTPVTHDATGPHAADPICPAPPADDEYSAVEGYGIAEAIRELSRPQTALLSDADRIRLIAHLAREGAHVTPDVEHLAAYKDILVIVRRTEAV